MTGPRCIAASDTKWRVRRSPVDGTDLRPGDTFQDCDESPRMIVVPAGSFVMDRRNRSR